MEKTQVMWQEKQLHVDVSGVGNEMLYADYDMLERAVMNYMTNAIDHTPTRRTYPNSDRRRCQAYCADGGK